MVQTLVFEIGTFHEILKRSRNTSLRYLKNSVAMESFQLPVNYNPLKKLIRYFSSTARAMKLQLNRC